MRVVYLAGSVAGFLTFLILTANSDYKTLGSKSSTSLQSNYFWAPFAVLIQKSGRLAMEYNEYKNGIDNSGFNGLAISELTEKASARADMSQSFISTFCDHSFTAFATNPKVCLYRQQDDVWVSGFIIRHGAWEFGEVSLMLNVTQNYSRQFGAENVLFVDVGANLGSFTLPVASSGVHTIAIEPLDETVKRLATSIVLNKLEDKVTLVTHPVSNANDDCLNFGRIPQDNRGASWMKKVDCVGSEGKEKLASVTLDHLLSPLIDSKNDKLHVVLKMDIESFEVYAILGAKQFLKTGKVRAIFMEWKWIQFQMRNQRNPGYKKVADEAMSFLTQELNFEVYSFPKLTPLSFEQRMSEWTADIILAQPGYLMSL